MQYAEDCDYTVRLVRTKCPLYMEPNPARLATHVGSAAWKTTGGSSNMASLVQRGGNNFDYLLKTDQNS